MRRSASVEDNLRTGAEVCVCVWGGGYTEGVLLNGILDDQLCACERFTSLTGGLRQEQRDRVIVSMNVNRQTR